MAHEIVALILLKSLPTGRLHALHNVGNAGEKWAIRIRVLNNMYEITGETTLGFAPLVHRDGQKRTLSRQVMGSLDLPFIVQLETVGSDAIGFLDGGEPEGIRG